MRALTTLQADNGTALGDAITRSVDLGLDEPQHEGRRRRARRSSSCSSRTAPARPATQTPLEAAAAAKAKKVPVYTVALGTDAGTITITTADGQERALPRPARPATLSAVAETTGGKFFAAADAKSLQSVYSRIGSQVGTQVEQHEVTAVLTGAGAVLLLAGSALSLAWFNRLP